MAETIRIEIPIVIVDKTDPVLSKAQEKMTKFERAVQRMEKSMRDLSKERYQLHLEVEEATSEVSLRITPDIITDAFTESKSMPDAYAFFDHMMDEVDALQGRISELTDFSVWENADFFGKVEIRWDEIIGKSFRTWWEAEGKRSITEAVAESGNWLGNEGTGGVQALFGIDMQKAAEEGNGIAEAFFKGLMEGVGIDTAESVFKKLFESVIKGLFSDVLGRDSPMDFLLSSLIGNASQGTGLLGFGATQAINMGAGNLAGGASLGANSLSALGIGAMSGAVIGTAGIISGFSDLKKAAQHTYNKEQQEQETRTGLTKIGMVGTGAAAGAAIGSFIPGIGNVIGAGIGAGIGGLGALFLGEDVGNLIGHLYGARDLQQQALIDMGNDLQSAMEGYHEIVNRNEYASELVRQYEKLETAMNAEGLTSDEAVLIQEQMGKVAEKLQELFPGLISDYDLLNGKAGDRLELLKAEMDLMDKQEERRLRQTVQDTKENLPALKESLSDVNGRLAAADDDWETKHEYREGLQGYLSEYYETIDRDGVSQEEVDEAMKELLDKSNELSEEMGQGDYFNHTVGIGGKVEELKSETAMLLEEMDGLNEKKRGLEETLSSYNEASIQLIAKDNGMDVSSLLESIDKYNQMQEALQGLLETERLTEDAEEILDAFLPGFSGHSGDVAMQEKMLKEGIEEIESAWGGVLDELQNISRQLQELPEEKKISIVLVEVPEQPQLPYKDGLKKPTPGGWRGEIDENADGGFVNGAQLSWIGEDGPEAVIPLGRKRRARGLSLWKQAGELLGIGRYAEGAILGADFRMGSYHQKPSMDIWDTGTEEQDVSVMVKVPGDAGKQVSFKVDISPKVQIEVEQGNAIEAIRAKMHELTDDICADIANKLAAVFSNTPQEA